MSCGGCLVRGMQKAYTTKGRECWWGCGLVYLLVLAILAAALPVVSLCASGTTVLSKVAKLPREQALGSCACAALARPTLPPQDNCTSPPPLPYRDSWRVPTSRWHEPVGRWRGIA